MNPYTFLIGWVIAGVVFNFSKGLWSTSFLLNLIIGLTVAFIIQSARFHRRKSR